MSQTKTKTLSDYSILLVVAAAYVIIVSSVAIWSHYRFHTNAWDLGIYSQALYSTLNQGRMLFYSAELPGNPSGSFFGIHFSPFLFLLVPIYAIYQNPVTLLVLRPIAISIGLVPLYKILREQQLKSRGLVVLLSIVYLVYPPMVTPLSSFDVEAFLPAIFLFTIHYLQKGKLLYSYIFVVLALMVNEFVPLIVISMALYSFLLHREEILEGLRRRKLTKNAVFSIILLLSGVLWFKLATVVITHFNPNALSTKWEWGEFGTSPSEIVTSVLVDPTKTIRVLFNDGQKKFLYIACLLGPLVFLPLLDPLPLIMALPWLIASLLSINPLYYAIETHYPAFVSAFIFFSAVNGIKRLVNSNREMLGKVAFLMFVSLLIATLLLPTVGYFEVAEAYEPLRLAVEKIPASASASVMPEVFPHLCNRLEVYPYFKGGVDYVLINVYSWWYAVTLPRPTHVAPRWCDAEIGDEYGVVVNANGVVLYEKGYNGSPIIFEGVDFTYTCHSVMVATGRVIQDNVTVGGSQVKADVLVHKIDDPTPLFFKVSQNVLPPGVYNVTAIFKVLSASSGEVVAFEAEKTPEHVKILSEKIMGADFIRASAWQVFSFSFAVEKPTFIEMAAYVTDCTDVYFYSMNVLQVSGSV